MSVQRHRRKGLPPEIRKRPFLSISYVKANPILQMPGGTNIQYISCPGGGGIWYVQCPALLGKKLVVTNRNYSGQTHVALPIHQSNSHIL